MFAVIRSKEFIASTTGSEDDTEIEWGLADDKCIRDAVGVTLYSEADINDVDLVWPLPIQQLHLD